MKLSLSLAAALLASFTTDVNAGCCSQNHKKCDIRSDACDADAHSCEFSCWGDNTASKGLTWLEEDGDEIENGCIQRYGGGCDTDADCCGDVLFCWIKNKHYSQCKHPVDYCKSYNKNQCPDEYCEVSDNKCGPKSSIYKSSGEQSEKSVKRSTATGTTGKKGTSRPRSDDRLAECVGYAGAVHGDPHITTFDGYTHDCQGTGEYYLVNSNDAVIQGLFDKLRSNAYVAYAKGIAISVPGAASIQVSVAETESGNEAILRGECPYHIYVNGALTEGTSISEDSYYVDVGSREITVQYFDGDEATYAVVLQTRGTANSNTCHVNAYVCIPSGDDTFLDSVVGLLGTPTGDKTDEWTTGDGTELEMSRKRQDEFEYCTTYHCVDAESDSLFVHEDISFSDREMCQAEYQGTIDLSEAPEEIVEICGDDEDCLLDGIVLGTEAAISAVDVANTITKVHVSDAVVDVTADETCPGDIVLVSTDGSTEYDGIPFTIVSQDTDSVTISLQPLWWDGVEIQYTDYVEDFVEKCIAATDVTTEYNEEITLSCPGTSDVAFVSVIGSDSLLDASADTAEAPQCCHAGGDNNPKVKFTFQVACVSQCDDTAASTSRRMLRSG